MELLSFFDPTDSRVIVAAGSESFLFFLLFVVVSIISTIAERAKKKKAEEERQRARSGSTSTSARKVEPISYQEPAPAPVRREPIEIRSSKTLTPEELIQEIQRKILRDEENDEPEGAYSYDNTSETSEATPTRSEHTSEWTSTESSAPEGSEEPEFHPAHGLGLQEIKRHLSAKGPVTSTTYVFGKPMIARDWLVAHEIMSEPVGKRMAYKARHWKHR